MKPNTSCPKCSSRMEEGFLLDKMQNGSLPEIFVQGQPERSFWNGTKVKGRAQYLVESYRCTKCGYMIKSYHVQQSQ